MQRKSTKLWHFAGCHFVPRSIFSKQQYGGDGAGEGGWGVGVEINKSDVTSQMSHINFSAFIHADNVHSF